MVQIHTAFGFKYTRPLQMAGIRMFQTPSVCKTKCKTNFEPEQTTN